MSDSLFFCNVDRSGKLSNFILELEQFSMLQSKQVYIIKKALGSEDKYSYSYEDIAIILIPKHSVTLMNYGPRNSIAFDTFFFDFIEDLSSLSDKYDYRKALGRSRDWRHLIKKYEFDDVTSINGYLDAVSLDGVDERKVDLLISLMIGSINDIDKIGLDNPETVLDKVKKKIVLFDGMQSRFIYEDIGEKCITIQGLAGTGKTELLLHKLQKTYMKNKDSRIVFTCFNKVLAEDMRSRIPNFFNFMKAEEQIEWNERLWVFSSWGSENDKNSGLYSYICNHYGLDFKRYNYASSIESVSKDALNQLEKIQPIECCFDYIFIDESQDFGTNFFDLCNLVTKEKVYIAGDIFQNIFDVDFEKAVDCSYLLNKCYRTDPKTLMFAHSVGMGLYEKPVVRWLEDKEWELCGYEFCRQDEKLILHRSPIRRFEDVENNNSIRVIRSSVDDMATNIINSIDRIVAENPTAGPDDIAVVFPNNHNSNFTIVDKLSSIIYSKFGWMSCKGYETKRKIKNQLFISNKNNIKGLEFPFVICFLTNEITDYILQRNSIYMILTRSFLTSYFIVDNVNEDFLRIYENAASCINHDGFMNLREPSPEEKKAQAKKVMIAVRERSKSIEEIINDVCKSYPKMLKKDKAKLLTMVPDLIRNETKEEIELTTKDMIKMFLRQ